MAQQHPHNTGLLLLLFDACLWPEPPLHHQTHQTRHPRDFSLETTRPQFSHLQISGPTWIVNALATSVNLHLPSPGPPGEEPGTWGSAQAVTTDKVFSQPESQLCNLFPLCCGLSTALAWWAPPKKKHTSMKTGWGQACPNSPSPL